MLEKEMRIFLRDKVLACFVACARVA